MNKRAFTLAEILVTLMIIGVIAAMTIPTLNTNIKNNEHVAGCLKAYSVLSGAIDRMKVEFGPIGLGKKWNNETEFWKEFTKQLNIVKICDSGQSGCFPTEKYKYLNNSVYYSYSNYKQSFVTADGMIYNWSKSDCGGKGLVDGVPTASDRNSTNCMGRFLVDINGTKGPNKFGYDTFFFVLVKGKGILPAGNDNKAADCNKSGAGLTCAAKVINEKKIDYK